MENSYKGKLKARVIDLRFAASGKLISLNKKRGDLVKMGELVARLDKKPLQAELDKQLGDFERVRAEFEIFNLQKGEPKDDITKYLKSGKQAELNISVKEVEIAKAKLDLTDLFSPIDGFIVDDSDLVPGLNITPASNPITIVDSSSYYFVFDIVQKEVTEFLAVRNVEIMFEGIEKKYSGNTLPLFSSKDGKIVVEVKLEDSSGLFLGLVGEAKIS